MRPVVAAFAFLTRLPVWRGPLVDRDLGRSVSFFPLVGLVIGLVLTGLCFAVEGWLPPLVVAVLVAAAAALLTGGLHLDGLADLFDALGGGRGDRARMLEIMRDSRVGSHGAAALVLVLLLKVAALAHLVARHDLLAVLAFPTFARWAVTPLIVAFPYARPEGLGRSFNGEAGRGQVLGATAIAAVVMIALGGRFVLPALGALAAALVLAFWVVRRLGGLTGDVYGAAVEVAEVTALVVATASA
jgi:adenosylcobinamide-GDP ribazoletransferase